MSNLGIASEDSEKAVKKLSDGLQGIPTTLDDASLSVQRFTSVNGDVDKSTEYFLALNNALLAGGASADIQTTAMEQLSQAYAKGKPDMIEWRSLQTAMPAQLKQVAEAFNMTTDELGEALRNGKISMNDFMDKIVELNKNGTGEFQSFEEQAKNSTGGIKTSIINVKTAITRGVTEITTAIDKALQNIGLGGLGTVISKIGSIAESVLKKVASSIPKVVQKIKDIYNWTNKNKEVLKALIKVIASVTAGYLAYKTTLIAINTIQMAKNILGTVSAFLSLIPAIKSAKDMMLLLNMTFSANPIGLVIAGVVALTTALVLLSSKQTEAQKKSKEFAEEMKNSQKAYEEYNQSIDDTTNANLAQIDSVSRLKDELKTLVDENGNVKKGYEARVDFILKQLNEALGTEYKRTGEIVEKYKELEGEIDGLIKKKRAQIILQGEEEKYSKAIDEERQATEDLTKAEKELGMTYAEAKEEWNNYYRARANQDIGKELTQKELDIIKKYSNGKIDVLDNMIAGCEDAERRINKSLENQKSYEKNYELFVNEEYDKIGNTTINTTKNWTDETTGSIKKAITEQAKDLESYRGLYERTGSEIAKQNVEQAQKNLENLANELVARTKTIGELGEEEKQAWKTLGESSYENYSVAISQMSPDMQQKIQEATGIIAAGTPEMQAMAGELGRKTVEEFDKSADARQKALNTITGYLNGLTDEEKRKFLSEMGFENADVVLQELDQGNLSEENGRHLLEGLYNGLQSKDWKSKILGVASGLAKAVNKAFTGKDGWDEHSPSKKMKKFAEYYIQPISDVMRARKKKITDTAKDLANSVNKSFEIEKINDEIYRKLQNAIAIENASITAKATLEANKSQPTIIARDHTTTINNTQQFYSKESTPYEEQKQAKQQLRRLAYEL